MRRCLLPAGTMLAGVYSPNGEDQWKINSIPFPAAGTSWGVSCPLERVVSEQREVQLLSGTSLCLETVEYRRG